MTSKSEQMFNIQQVTFNARNDTGVKTKHFYNKVIIFPFFLMKKESEFGKQINFEILLSLKNKKLITFNDFRLLLTLLYLE